MSDPCYVYRLYGHNKYLLYIGQSENVDQRIAQHGAGSKINAKIVSFTSEQHSDRKAALKAERVAIFRERPRYNRNCKMFLMKDYAEQFDVDPFDYSDRQRVLMLRFWSLINQGQQVRENRKALKDLLDSPARLLAVI